MDSLNLQMLPSSLDPRRLRGPGESDRAEGQVYRCREREVMSYACVQSYISDNNDEYKKITYLARCHHRSVSPRVSKLLIGLNLHHFQEAAGRQGIHWKDPVPVAYRILFGAQGLYEAPQVGAHGGPMVAELGSLMDPSTSVLCGSGIENRLSWHDRSIPKSCQIDPVAGR